MRSAREIAFRLGQEFHNARLWVLPPQPRLSGPVARDLPDLRGTEFEQTVIDLAGRVLAGRYPLFGTAFNLGSNPDWRRDFLHGQTSDRKYFRLVPYLDFQAVGDHKVIWELNRHQWLVLLAMAWRFTGDERYPEAIRTHLRSWVEANPFQTGINWCSALEVAFRALSWIWVWQIAGVGEAVSLYQHGLHLERNLSYYFSPNTHLLGEAMVLHALGAAFPGWPRAAHWRAVGGKVVSDQLDAQIEKDGSHFEQSSYYHVYALDMFLLHRAFGGDIPDDRIAAMADYLYALLGPELEVPLIGDDDGGRLFHPYGCGTRFGRATLATCAVLLGRTDWPYRPEDLHEQAAWWLGAQALRKEPNPGQPLQSASFRNSGLVVLARGGTHVLFDAGPFGRGPAGHSHADTLSLIVRNGDDEILVDSGTFTYVADPAERDRFRGTAAHNTVVVDGLDQAVPAGPFRWNEKPEVQMIEAGTDSASGICRTTRYVHRRRVELRGSELHVADDIEGGDRIDQYWHLGPGVDPSRVVADNAVVEESWRSTVYGRKERVPVVRVAARGPRAQLTTVIKLEGKA